MGIPSLALLTVLLVCGLRGSVLGIGSSGGGAMAQRTCGCVRLVAGLVLAVLLVGGLRLSLLVGLRVSCVSLSLLAILLVGGLSLSLSWLVSLIVLESSSGNLAWLLS